MHSAANTTKQPTMQEAQKQAIKKRLRELHETKSNLIRDFGPSSYEEVSKWMNESTDWPAMAVKKLAEAEQYLHNQFKDLS